MGSGGGEDVVPTEQSGPDVELSKPVELERLGPAAEGLFDMLAHWFDTGERLTADLSSIYSEAIAAELHDPQMVARFTMRRLQALFLIAQPGTRTTTDVIVTQIDSVLRALLETPSRHLKRESDNVDWDHEWAVLDAGMLLAMECPEEEAARFTTHVQALISARDAVLEASEERIRVFR